MRLPLAIKTSIRPPIHGSRVSPTFFRERDHWRVAIHVGDMKSEDEYLQTECWRGKWARTRYEDHVLYQFEDQMDAMMFKMRFNVWP